MSIALSAELMLARKLVSPSQLALCARAQQTPGESRSLADIAVDLGFVSRLDIDALIRDSGGVSHTQGSVQLPYRLMKRLLILPLGLDGEVLTVAAADRLSQEECSDLILAASTVTNGIVKRLAFEPMDRRLLLQTINLYATADSVTVALSLARLGGDGGDAGGVTQLIEQILADALQSRASDIHITNTDQTELAWIAYRVDGRLNYRYQVLPAAVAVLATRIKSMAGIDFTDTTMPHDGRLSTRYLGRVIDARVSTLPVDIGEEIVIRLLDIEQVPSLARLFQEHPEVDRAVHQIADVRGKSGGIILVTGPTGSGKSTTLNALIRAMDRASIAVRTVEDPVELRVPLVGHVQVNEAAGLTYSKALRAILRQDPDVIMIGELRDSETAEIALQAADTGHAVLSTLHTGSVVESISRLFGMLSESYRAVGRLSLSNTLRCVINQRLVQRLCVCAEEADVGPHERYLLSALNLSEGQLVGIPWGCSRCNDTGYFGRIIVPEMAIFPGDGEVRSQMESVITSGESTRQLMKIPGITWYTQEDAIRNLVCRRLIDLRTAAILLNRQGRAHG